MPRAFVAAAMKSAEDDGLDCSLRLSRSLISDLLKWSDFVGSRPERRRFCVIEGRYLRRQW